MPDESEEEEDACVYCCLGLICLPFLPLLIPCGLCYCVAKICGFDDEEQENPSSQPQLVVNTLSIPGPDNRPREQVMTITQQTKSLMNTLDNRNAASVEELKTKGLKQFLSGNYMEAIEEYNKALSMYQLPKYLFEYHPTYI